MVLELTMHTIILRNLLFPKMGNYSGTELKVGEDWRYSKQKLEIRQQALTILLKKYGSELDNTRKSKYTNQSIYECAHDWVSQGNVNCNGIAAYYEAYYHAKSN